MVEQYDRKWWMFYVVAGVLTVVALFQIWLITWPAVEASRTGQPLPADWTRTRIIVADLFTLLLSGTLAGVGLVELLTSFTEDGIRGQDCLAPLT